jgi:hypothetical protein
MKQMIHSHGRGSRSAACSVLLLLLLSACANKQGDSLQTAAMIDPVGVASGPMSYDVRLRDNPEAEEMTLIMGPAHVPVSGSGHAHGGDHQGVLPEPRTIRIPKDITITGIRYEVVDGDGSELPRGILHHMNVIDPDRRELFLPISHRMLAVGKETGAQSLPEWLIGYPIKRGTEPVITVMLHNPTHSDLQGVYVLLTLEYEDALEWTPVFGAYPFQVDVSFPAGDKQFDLPPGRSIFSWDGSPAMEGRILALGSHLHDHAEKIRLEDLTAGEVIWEGYPVVDDEGAIRGVTTGKLYWKGGKKLFPDHTYRATVVYNNPTSDTLRGGGMGVVAGLFRPAQAATWPVADRSDHLYRLDRQHYLREVSGPYEEIAEHHH